MTASLTSAPRHSGCEQRQTAPRCLCRGGERHFLVPCLFLCFFCDFYWFGAGITHQKGRGNEGAVPYLESPDEMCRVFVLSLPMRAEVISIFFCSFTFAVFRVFFPLFCYVFFSSVPSWNDRSLFLPVLLVSLVPFDVCALCVLGIPALLSLFANLWRILFFLRPPCQQ